MTSDATKISLSPRPIRIGDPLVEVQILSGCYLSITTRPHWELGLTIFSTYLKPSAIDLPSFLNLPSN